MGINLGIDLNPIKYDPLAVYNPSGLDFYLTSLTKWWRLPHENGGTTLVVSVSSKTAGLWIVAYTILVTLIFMAACKLATAVVLTYFKLGNSGNRHAILVAYYNAGAPSTTIPLMLGYLQNALGRCKKNNKWAVDWDAVWASFGLFFLAFSLLSGNVLTKFLLGGKGLVVGNVAQASPAAVFYPRFKAIEDGAGNFAVGTSEVFALKSLLPLAVSQAVARKTNAEKYLETRIDYKETRLLDGRGAQFEYRYNLTGYEMGLRDAHQLLFTVHGNCATYIEPNGVPFKEIPLPSDSPENNAAVEGYLFYGGKERIIRIFLSRENYTAPWAEYVDRSDSITQAQNKLYGGWTFEIVPHTAWRSSLHPNPNVDPWYETEENPAYRPDLITPEDNTYSWLIPQYRVKKGRPVLRCTQNDTWSYNGQTVHHVSLLGDLPGLNATLSPLFREWVFGLEFGSPVFSKLLGALPFGTLPATGHFDADLKVFDATRASTFTDFKSLVQTSFVYSREVVRNSVLLYSFLAGRHESLLNNAASKDNLTIPAENADIFLQSTDVSAMSVLVMVVTPCVCAFLWLLVLYWGKKYDPESDFDNKSANSRHGLRRYGYQAVNLFLALDEAISGKRKWSGRNTLMPYIRDLDTVRDTTKPTLPVPALVPTTPENISPPESPAPENGDIKPAVMEITAIPDGPKEPVIDTVQAKENMGERISFYVKPKVTEFTGEYEAEPPGFFKRVVNTVCFWRKRTPKDPPKQYEIKLTTEWNEKLPRIPWKHIRGDV